MSTKASENHEPAVRSAELNKAMVAVAFQLSMVDRDIEQLRHYLTDGASTEHVRFNLMSAVLSAAVLQERLVQMQIIAAGEKA